tara:strand:- start:4223 stop:4972 length:750 start_codon:yes stop_codon:yes gene_type:complete
MVKKREKLAATQYICDLAENSGRYHILGRDGTSATVKESEAEDPKTVQVLIPNFLGSRRKFNEELAQNTAHNVYSSPIFYKDGKTGFVRMVDTNMSWRADKSLKRYTPQEINEMLHLRGMEKESIELFGEPLFYFQPKTTRLNQSIRGFTIGEVILDYSHIEPDELASRFVEDRVSINYALPNDIGSAEEAIEFAPRVRGRYLWAPPKRAIPRNTLRERQVQRDLEAMAQSAYPDLDLEEALKHMNPDN